MESRVVYAMVANAREKRPPGRPREFDPDAALDRAVELFWADGFEGVDVERIARAAGITKPSLYRLFGDKSSLFLHALRRYGRTVGAGPLITFEAEADIADAVTALLVGTVKAATTEGRPRGCLMACVAVTQAERSEQIREALAHGLATLSETLARRFEKEMSNGRLSVGTSARTRSQMVVDIMQGLMMRARAGASTSSLLENASDYVELVLS